MDQKLYVQVLKFLLIVLVTILFFFPIYWIFSMAFKPFPEWTAAGGKIYWFPNNPTIDNFRAIFSRKLEMSPIAGTAIRPIVNSLTVSIIGTAIAMVVGIFAAYGVSRYKAGGSLPFMLLQLRMFPPIAIIIPIMIMWAFLRMIDTWYGLVIIYGVVTLPFSTWLMKTFFDDIPRELDEAAIVDGCSNIGAFFKVVIPTDRRWTTIPVHISKLQSAMVGALYGPKAALGMIAAVPPIIFGIIIQKYLVRGLTFGAIKK